jgi:hypothetical protein
MLKARSLGGLIENDRHMKVALAKAGKPKFNRRGAVTIIAEDPR